jgi:hypothetical protein
MVTLACRQASSSASANVTAFVNAPINSARSSSAKSHGPTASNLSCAQWERRRECKSFVNLAGCALRNHAGHGSFPSWAANKSTRNR